MKNDLSCGVVRDLLPSYIEGLLGEESKEAVDRHLEGCPECRGWKDAMSTLAEKGAEPEKEVDYLKQVKRATRKRIILSVIVTAVGLLAVLGLKAFVIGTPLQPQSVAVIAAEVQPGNSLFLSLSSTSSGNAFHGWKVETVDGVASIYARDVLVSPLYSAGNAHLYVSLENVREVWLGGISGQLLWKEGLVIGQKTLDLLEAKTPYCGDAPALGHIAELLQVESGLGPYTMSLQTSSRPYTWTLEFQQSLNTKESRTLRYYMVQMLALVENLDKVAYTYESEDAPGRTAEERTQSGGVSAETAARVLARLTELHNEKCHTDWPVHESVKEYAESPLEYQRMVTLLKERYISEY